MFEKKLYTLEFSKATEYNLTDDSSGNLLSYSPDKYTRFIKPFIKLSYVFSPASSPLLIQPTEDWQTDMCQ